MQVNDWHKQRNKGQADHTSTMCDSTSPQAQDTVSMQSREKIFLQTAGNKNRLGLEDFNLFFLRKQGS